MTQHYRKSVLLPLLFFMLFCVSARPARAAELAPALRQFQPFNAPQNFPDLSFRAKDGSRHKLSEYRGQLVLVNFWATWCIPCRAEVPALDHLQTVFKNSKFQILPISMDDRNHPEKITEFFDTNRIKSLPQLGDPDVPSLEQLRPDGLPTSYLITADGRAVGKIEGFADWDSEEAANLIEAYLPKSK